MKKKKMLSILLVAVLGLSAFATGCGKGDAGEEKKPLKAAYLCDRLGDKAFNDIAWEGFQKASQDFGLEIKVVEYGTDKSKFDPSVIDAAENNDIVAFSGNEFMEIVEKHYQEFPDTKFIGVDIPPDYQVEMPNVFAVYYAQNEGDYLAGVLAQKMSKTGIVGFLGGAEVIVINDFLVGFVEGSKRADPNGRITISYVGDFVNATKAKEMGLLMIQQKADILHQVAGAAGLGMFEACQEKGALGIGVDADQRAFFLDSKPEIADVIITSMLKRNDIAMYNMLKGTVEGTLAYGTLETMGVKEGVTALVEDDYYKEMVPQEARDYLEEIKGEIVEKKIKVSSYFGMEQSEFVKIRDSVRL